MSRVTENMGRNNFPPDDNPFRTKTIQPPFQKSEPNICGVIVGLTRSDMITFLQCFSKATRNWVFYIRRDYKEGCMVAYDFAEWDTNSIAIQQMLCFLHLLADTGRPVAFIRFGKEFEAWANENGYEIFRNRVSFGRDHSGFPAIVFAPDDYEDKLL